MADDPHVTLKFKKIVPLDSPRTAAALTGSPKPGGAGRQDPSIDWEGDDELPTQRGPRVAPAPQSIPSPAKRPSLTVLEGLHAGQVFALGEEEEAIVGRGRDAEVRIDDAGVSRKHARIVRSAGGGHVLEDLGSTNGLFVNGQKVERVSLTNGDRVQIGPALLLRFSLIAADEEALACKLYESSTRDGLTRLYNRKYAWERLASEVAYAHRHGTPLSVVLFDLDHFKRVNDTFGHQAGDAVLRGVAANVQKTIRAEDILARFGGEEFLVIVRGIEPAGAAAVAERIRRGVELLAIRWEEKTLNATVSVGVASLRECVAKGTAEALAALGDERLYRAKAGGRNRVC